MHIPVFINFYSVLTLPTVWTLACLWCLPFLFTVQQNVPYMTFALFLLWLLVINRSRLCMFCLLRENHLDSYGFIVCILMQCILETLQNYLISFCCKIFTSQHKLHQENYYDVHWYQYTQRIIISTIMYVNICCNYTTNHIFNNVLSSHNVEKCVDIR